MAKKKAQSPTLEELNARMRSIGEISQRFADDFAKPVRVALERKNPVEVASAMFRLPMEAAASGFDVHIVQKPDGWHLEIRQDIDDDCEFHIYAHASGLVATVIQIAHVAAQTLAQMSSDTRALIQAEMRQETPAA